MSSNAKQSEVDSGNRMATSKNLPRIKDTTDVANWLGSSNRTWPQKNFVASHLAQSAQSFLSSGLSIQIVSIPSTAPAQQSKPARDFCWKSAAIACCSSCSEGYDTWKSSCYSRMSKRELISRELLFPSRQIRLRHISLVLGGFQAKWNWLRGELQGRGTYHGHGGCLRRLLTDHPVYLFFTVMPRKSSKVAMRNAKQSAGRSQS